jgi:hypothetical protein
MKRAILVVSVTLLGILALSGVLVHSKPVSAQEPPASPVTMFWTVTTCTSANGLCTQTVTIPNGGFVDSNYVVTCEVQNWYPVAVGFMNKKATNFELLLIADPPANGIPSGTVAGCIAMHS